MFWLQQSSRTRHVDCFWVPTSCLVIGQSVAVADFPLHVNRKNNSLSTLDLIHWETFFLSLFLSKNWIYVRKHRCKWCLTNPTFFEELFGKFKIRFLSMLLNETYSTVFYCSVSPKASRDVEHVQTVEKFVLKSVKNEKESLVCYGAAIETWWLK